MRFMKQQGSVLITLVVAMTLMAALGTGIYSLTTSSTFGELLTNNNDAAYNLAKAGIRYAVSLNTTDYTETTFSMPDNKHTFKIVISSGKITSTGTVNAGTFLAASRVLKYDASWVPAPISTSLGAVVGDNTTPTISNPAVPAAQQAVVVDSVNNQIVLGGDGGTQEAYGSIWYQANNSFNNCTSGVCSFNSGLRAYFEFMFTKEDYSTNSTTFADGFTFAVMSAINNTPPDRTGGNVNQGELMGYAGGGNTTDGLGLNPPKMALEFDTYPNAAGTNFCSAGSRNDPNPTNFRNHAALMFWGARTLSGTCSGDPRGSYDDNRHGAGGSGGDPQNSIGTADTGYYQGTDQTCKSSGNTCNWMEDGYLYSSRIEIERPPSNSANGTYNYTMKAWIVRSDTLSGLTKTHFQDVIVPFTDTAAPFNTTPMPQINKTVPIVNSSSFNDHSDLDQVYFGFTEATGASTQQVTVKNFNIFFPQASICTYSLSPASANYMADGGPGSFGVTSSCPWIASSAVNWITTNSYAKGNGTVSFTILPYTGATARIGQINVAGQTFTVTQYGVCSYALSPTSASFGACQVTGNTVNVTAGPGCTWTAAVAASDAAWITINSGSSGMGNGTVNYGVAANAGPTRTGTMTIAGQSFPITSNPALTITTASLPDGRRNIAYTTTTVTASGGVTPYTWSQSGLPSGLSINASTGVISGTPTAVGLFSPTITVADTCPSVSRTYNNLRIKYETYTITNNTGATIYRQSGSSCQTSNSISNGGTYSIPYNGTAVRFYQTRGSGNSCSGSNISISGASADSADVNYNGAVRINNAWQLVDN